MAAKSVDTLIQQASEWTPRESVVFLMTFDKRFREATGREATRVERLILTSLLRRRAGAER